MWCHDMQDQAVSKINCRIGSDARRPDPRWSDGHGETFSEAKLVAFCYPERRRHAVKAKVK